MTTIRNFHLTRVTLLAAAAALASTAFAIDPPEIDWFTIDCGGGTSTQGDFVLMGTIGQHDAGSDSSALTGGGFSLVGGFWTNDDPCGTADFDGDGDIGTDADIEAFFACLGGNCCALCFPGGADFNGDGDIGTDADIEAFFRVLAGAPCLG